MKFKNGDIVFDVSHGWGEITDDKAEMMGTEVLRVTFKKWPDSHYTYNRDGKASATDYARALLTENEANLLGHFKPAPKAYLKNILYEFFIEGKKFAIYEVTA